MDLSMGDPMPQTTRNNQMRFWLQFDECTDLTMDMT